MKFSYTKKIDCHEMSELFNAEKCSDDIRNELEEKLNIKLMARNDKDTVNGFINIIHAKNNHQIEVHIYEKDESSGKNHLTTFKKPSKMPKQSDFK